MKCIALLTCEKIIIDKEGAHSIINVMLNATVTFQQPQSSQPLTDIAIPSNAVVPNQWWIYSLWNPSTEDLGVTFEQVYQVYWPGGEKMMERRLVPFTATDKLQQTTFSIFGFPAGELGKVRVVTWLDSQGNRVSEISEIHINVDHAPLPASGSAGFSGIRRPR
jgi:hypothetical protein